MFNIAYNLGKMKSKNATKYLNKIDKIWKVLGGDTALLWISVEKNKNKRPIFGKKGQPLREGTTNADGESLGVAGYDDAAILAWVATGSTAIGVVSKVIKDFKKDSGDTLSADEDASDSGGSVDEETDAALKDEEGDGEEEGFFSEYKWYIVGGIALFGLITTIVLTTGNKKK